MDDGERANRSVPGTVRIMAKHNPNLLIDEHRWLNVPGCYARIGDAAVNVLLEMRRDGHNLESVWIDLQQRAGRAALSELLSMAREGNPIAVLAVKVYNASPSDVVALQEAGYPVELIEITPFVVQESSAPMMTAPR